jgi:hypothetical protein
MTEFPERIYKSAFTAMSSTENPFPGGIEYVRADVSAARIAELEAANRGLVRLNEAVHARVEELLDRPDYLGALDRIGKHLGVTFSSRSPSRIAEQTISAINSKGAAQMADELRHPGYVRPHRSADRGNQQDRMALGHWH